MDNSFFSTLFSKLLKEDTTGCLEQIKQLISEPFDLVKVVEDEEENTKSLGGIEF